MSLELAWISEMDVSPDRPAVGGILVNDPVLAAGCCLIDWPTPDIVDTGIVMGDNAGLTDGIGADMGIDDMPRPLDVGNPKLGVKLCDEDVGSLEVTGAAEVCI